MSKATYLVLLGMALLGLVACRLFVVQESFDDAADPQKLLERVKGILDKIDNPELINHILSVADKDPGQLARMYIKSQEGTAADTQ